jgi:galactokinase
VSLHEQVQTLFQQHFGAAPSTVVRAPGRVNLIGEHTDYNDGFVLPMAIDRAAWIALRPRSDHLVRVYSPFFDQEVSFRLGATAGAKDGWVEYLRGTAWALQQNGFHLKGWEGVLVSDVPVGAGLSSSAAVEMATASAFGVSSNFGWDAPGMAKIGQMAENKWVGVNTGIMDQMISAAGKADHALLIDCRSLETTLVKLPLGTAAVVMDTATRRGLVDSAYNERRASCEAAAKFFAVTALRDVSLDQFEDQASQLDPMIRRRARHVITENARTLEAVQAMQRGDANRLGELMNDSHESLRDDFEVSSDALNSMVDAARREPGCYGARMTGAGFGGCAVALVEIAQAERFATAVAGTYQNSTGRKPAIYVCQATNGAEVVSQG